MSESTVPIAFQGEAQFLRYSDTSRSGQTITLQVEDREALEAFIGKEGRRFQIVMVLLSDQDEPEKPKAPPLGPLCTEAVGFCNRADFRAWVAHRTRNPNGFVATQEEAKAYILRYCRVGSRRKLDTIPLAGDLWRELKTCFYLHLEGIK